MRASSYSNEEVTYLDYEKKVRETDLATLFRLEDSGTDQWVPKSLIECDDDGILGVPTWWAKKNGLT